MPKPILMLLLTLTACGTEGGGDPRDPLTPDPPPPTADSLALARAKLAGTTHLVLVTGDDGTTIDGHDLGPLSGSIMDRVHASGLDGLLATAATAPTISVRYDVLLPPVDTTAPSINVAENYADHASETETGAEMPYLFPKVAAPTSATSHVAASTAELLDYETELCMVVGDDITSAAVFEPALKGFFLCNDLTDRAIQIRNADRENPSTAAGFTDAKSKPGYFPTGPFLVVANDWRAFVASVSLQLDVDEQRKQDAKAGDMVWPVDEIVAHTLAIGADARWQYNGDPIGVLAGNSIPAGTVFVTGTPGGVAFAPPSDEFVMDALGDYLLSGGPLTGMDPETFVRERYVESEKQSGKYLAPGNFVHASATKLGHLYVTID